jgi:hypothetical protein
MKRVLGGILLVVTLAACGSPAIRAGSVSPTPSPAQTPSYRGEQRYEFNGGVLENPTHGPELCGIMALSYPPQCGGVPVAGWSWSDAAGESRYGGTIWGSYRVVGTYNGKTFTVTEPPGPVHNSPDPPKAASPCAKPAGGWERPNPQRTTIEDVDAVGRYMEGQHDSAGLWLSDNPVGTNSEQDLTHAAINAGFTGDLERHEAEIRKLWGGGLCLFVRDRSLAELEKIRAQAQSYAKSIGLELRSSDANEVTWTVDIGVFFADAAAQKKMDDHFHSVTVKLLSEIKPVA